RLGWAEGRNVRLEYRWAAVDAEKMRATAKELVALAPDAILVSGQAVFDAMYQTTKTIPIVFAQVSDPFSSGAVATLARPGGNVTGFSNYASVVEKRIEILREIVPDLTETAVIFNPENASNVEQLHAVETALASTAMRLSQIAVRNSADT